MASFVEDDVVGNSFLYRDVSGACREGHSSAAAMLAITGRTDARVISLVS